MSHILTFAMFFSGKHSQRSAGRRFFEPRCRSPSSLRSQRHHRSGASLRRTCPHGETTKYTPHPSPGKSPRYDPSYDLYRVRVWDRFRSPVIASVQYSPSPQSIDAILKRLFTLATNVFSAALIMFFSDLYLLPRRPACSRRRKRRKRLSRPVPS